MADVIMRQGPHGPDGRVPLVKKVLVFHFHAVGARCFASGGGEGDGDRPGSTYRPGLR